MKPPRKSLLFLPVYFGLILILAVVGLMTGCASPTVTRIKTANADITHIGRGSFLENSDYEEEDDVMIVGADGNVEFRNRGKKHGKNQTSVASTYLTSKALVDLGAQTLEGTKSLHGLEKAKSADAVQINAQNVAPTVTEPGMVVDRAIMHQ